MCDEALFRPQAYSLLQSITELGRCHRSGNRSRGVSPLSAFAALEARSPRVCLARHRPPSGFRTLLAAYFFRSLPAVFHASNAHRVFPSGPFPLAEPWLPLGGPCLPGVSRSQILVSEKPKFLTASRPKLRLQGVTPCEDSTPAGQHYPYRKAAALLGLCPLGVSSPAWPSALALDPLLSLASAYIRERMLKAALQGLDRAGAGLPLSRLPPLLGFLHLVLPPSVQYFAMPSLWIHLSDQPLSPTLSR